MHLHCLDIELIKNFVKPKRLNLETYYINDINLRLPLALMHFGIKFEYFVTSELLEDEKIKPLKHEFISIYIEICEQIRTRFNFSDDKLKFLKYLNISQSLETFHQFYL